MENKKLTKIGEHTGVDLYGIKDEKFKTDTLNIFFIDELSQETAALNSLLISVLKRGTKTYPTMKDISIYLEGLYGCVFGCGVYKKGEMQILRFYIEGVSDKYSKDSDAYRKSVEFLIEVIRNPFLNEGNFIKEYVEQEKFNLKNLVEGRKNDKDSYSFDRCIEEMCREERFSIYEYGSVKDYDSIDEKILTEHYNNHFMKLPCIAFISGSLNEEKNKWMLDEMSKISRPVNKNIKYEWRSPELSELKEVEEKLAVTQGKLCIGYRSDISGTDPDYYSMLILNSILGGGMHSKLFQNVREKEGLAYYAYSRYDKYKGLVVMASGIEIANKNKVKDIMIKQLDDIKEGLISDFEIESAINSLETAINAMKDGQNQTVDFFFGQIICNTSDTLDELIKKAKRVTKEDCVKVAKRLSLDTVYFLTND